MISHNTIVAIAAGSFSTPKISVKTRKVANCDPPPTPGSWAAEPTIVNARTKVAPAKVRPASSPPNACATQTYIKTHQHPVRRRIPGECSEIAPRYGRHVVRR